MEENRFFRIVWRVNGIAIMLLLLIVMGIAAYSLIKEMFPSHPPAVITNVAEDPQGQEKWTLGIPEEIEGTSFIYIPLVSEKENISLPVITGARKSLHSYGGGYFSPTRNLLFVDKQTREMRWLFKDNRQLITNINMLSALRRNEKDRKVDVMLYHVIGKDTNGDKKLGSDDLADIAISFPDGTRYKEVLQSVERIYGAMSLGSQEALVLYQSSGKGYASTIRLKDLSVIETNEMPKSEQTP